MEMTDCWPLAWDTLQALTAHYGPPIDRAAEVLGIPFGQWYGWLMAARIFEPYPVSAARLHLRAAYTSPVRLEEYLANGVRLGLLEPAGREEYHLTPAGHAAVEHLIDTARAAMVPLQPLPPADAERLVSTLCRLVQASLAAPEPPGKWCLRIARHYDPGTRAPAIVRLDQYLSDLDAYRDDSHLAAWRPSELHGQAWEAFTLLWRHGPLAVDDVHERLARRGFSRAAYAEALHELAGRGWVTEERGMYDLSAAGRARRDEAEDMTDRFFYAPWMSLDGANLAELRGLLLAARDGLNRLRETPAGG